MSPAGGPGPLSGVRIVDLTAMLAGPFGTAILADLGADVIKIEPPAGDFTRGQGPFTDDDSIRAFGGYFQSVNRNKRSVVLDLAAEEGREHLVELVRGADAVIENYRHGVMDRMGLSYETLREVNPRLVYVAIRGFGDVRTGESPMRDWPAYDVTAQALSGFMQINGDPLGPPTKAGPGIGDTVPALYAVIGLLAALHRAEITGRGEFVDVAMYDAMLALCERPVYQYSYRGVVPGRLGNEHPLLSPFDVLPACDGWVTVAAPTDSQWARLCRLVRRDDLAKDERFASAAARVAHSRQVRAVLSAWTSVRTKEEIVRTLGGRISVAPVNTAADIFADPHVRARRMLTDVEQPGSARPVTIVGCPIKFAGLPEAPPRRAPLLGEHTAEVLAELPTDSLRGILYL